MMSVIKKVLLALFALGLCYFTIWLIGFSSLTKIEDDNYVGKTLLIYPTAGQFVLIEHWYFGKQSGDSYFYSSPPNAEGDPPPTLYRMVAKYQDVNYGLKTLLVSDVIEYLLEPVKGTVDKRLFFFAFSRCEEQTDLFDQDTNIKIDFVCD